MNVRPQDSVECAYGWAVAVVSTMMIAVAFGTSYLVVVGLKPIAADFGWPRQIPSAAYAMALFGAGIGGIFMGWWADRKGMGAPALFGAFFVGAGTIAAAYSPDAITFLAAHFLILGLLGNGAMFAPLLTNVTHWFDRRRGIAVAVVASGQSLAGAIWPPIFRYTIDEYGWQESMIGYGLFCFVTLIPLALVMRRPAPRPTVASVAAAEARGNGDGRVLRMPPNLALGLLCVAIVGCCVAMSMPMVHIVAHCSDLGFSAARGAEMLSILLACAFISRIGYGWLADRVGGLRTLFLGASLQLLGLACFVYVDSLQGLYLVSVFYGLGYGGIVPMYAIIVRELFRDSEAGWRMGVVFLFGTIGMALGGYFGGLIFDLTGSYRLAFLTGIGFNILNLVLVGFMLSRQGGGDRRAIPLPA
ncbi:MAG: MFS transporter [Alphaproteobacteria bacterium]|nr:MFS transporter [Alphaproteobacteria bacterium]MDP6816276.1 MFS transporter [Alphaproteobacteria bacterium]